MTTTTSSLPAETTAAISLTGNPQERLTHFLEDFLSQHEYELVAIEVIQHREKILRLFIDHANGVTIDACVEVTHLLDAPLETEPSIEEIFKGPYDLEVSSPGIERPLRKPSDFLKFAGKISRFHTFRPLTADETGAPLHVEKNPKQKNFYGILHGFDSETKSVQVGLVPEDGTLLQTRKETPIRIPLQLISKAHLEPEALLADPKRKKKGASQ